MPGLAIPHREPATNERDCDVGLADAWSVLVLASSPVSIGPISLRTNPGGVVKKWRIMALFRGPRSAISRAWSRGLSTQAADLTAFMSADLFGAREQEKCRAPFSGEDLFRRDAPWPYTPRRYGSYDLRQTQRCRPDRDLAAARHVPLLGCERICWFGHGSKSGNRRLFHVPFSITRFSFVLGAGARDPTPANATGGGQCRPRD